MQDGQRITPFITFEKNGKQAVDFYVSIFKNSTINSLMVMPGGDQLLHASFTLDGMKFMAMDAGPEFNFARGSSLFVTCQDQAEVDYYWEKLGENGEYEPCGWLKDKYGMSWQIVPTALGKLMSGPDPAKSGRVMQSMLQMSKLDIAGLQAAYDQ